MNATIDFTPEKLKQFKALYAQAVADGWDQFNFEGQPVVVSYAKYLIEYLESKF